MSVIAREVAYLPLSAGKAGENEGRLAGCNATTAALDFTHHPVLDLGAIMLVYGPRILAKCC